MKARLVLSATAVAVALAVTASLPGSATAAPPPAAPAAPAPVPLPTRPTDEVCDAWSVAQDLCDAVPTLLAATYSCWARVDMAASRNKHPFVSDLTLWSVDAYGFHGCPERSGDLVRVVGAMEAIFNGTVISAGPCGDLASCTTHGSATVGGYQYAAAVAIATTTTYSDPSGTMASEEFFVWV